MRSMMHRDQGFETALLPAAITVPPRNFWLSSLWTGKIEQICAFILLPFFSLSACGQSGRPDSLFLSTKQRGHDRSTSADPNQIRNINPLCSIIHFFTMGVWLESGRGFSSGEPTPSSGMAPSRLNPILSFLPYGSRGRNGIFVALRQCEILKEKKTGVGERERVKRGLTGECIFLCLWCKGIPLSFLKAAARSSQVPSSTSLLLCQPLPLVR